MKLLFAILLTIPWRISGYCPCKVCTPGLGITSSQRIPIQGITIACPVEIQNGTLLKITIWRDVNNLRSYSDDEVLYILKNEQPIGSRIFRCDDTGGLIKDRWLDVFHNNHEDAIHFGTRPARVEIVK